jgi:hypothetical protein
MRLQNKVMVGIKRALDPIKLFQNGYQIKNKVLTKEPIYDRLYHMNYNTSKQHKRFHVTNQWGRS